MECKRHFFSRCTAIQHTACIIMITEAMQTLSILTCKVVKSTTQWIHKLPTMTRPYLPKVLPYDKHCLAIFRASERIEYKHLSSYEHELLHGDNYQAHTCFPRIHELPAAHGDTYSGIPQSTSFAILGHHAISKIKTDTLSRHFSLSCHIGPYLGLQPSKGHPAQT